MNATLSTNQLAQTDLGSNPDESDKVTLCQLRCPSTRPVWVNEEGSNLTLWERSCSNLKELSVSKSWKLKAD